MSKRNHTSMSEKKRERERREKGKRKGRAETRDDRFLRWLSQPPLLRSKLQAGSQKLPVLVESAWSWIILPKGIFIGRECMQKRGHRHKGAAPADLALVQLREWTHGFKPAPEPLYPLGVDRTPRNGLPNFPSCASSLLVPLRRPCFPPPSSSLCESTLLIRFIEVLHQANASSRRRTCAVIRRDISRKRERSAEMLAIYKSAMNGSHFYIAFVDFFKLPVIDG